MKRFLSTLLMSAFLSSGAFAADISALMSLFKANFNSLYQDGACGINVGEFIKVANGLKIDLSHSYVLQFEGLGVLETSGFYTPGSVDERAMLGYFHVVLVADDYVFDFTLHQRLVMRLEDYVRLQFTPPYLPYRFYNVNMDPMVHLPNWTLTRYEWESFQTLRRQAPKTWKKSMDEVIDMNRMLQKTRDEVLADAIKFRESFQPSLCNHELAGQKKQTKKRKSPKSNQPFAD